MGQGEGGVIRRVTYTWWLLGLAVKVPWLGLGGPILALAAWTGSENADNQGVPTIAWSLKLFMAGIYSQHDIAAYNCTQTARIDLYRTLRQKL